jgi:regulatory protein
MRVRVKLLDQEALIAYALKALAARAHSSGELREKLRRKAEKKADIDVVLVRMKELGYLNDRTFSERYASRRLESEGFGKMRVLRDLGQKRVAPAVARQAVERAFSGTEETALIEQFLARKYRRQPLAEVLAEEKGLASAYRKLRLAGFSSGASLSVLKRHSRQAEALDALESESVDEEQG